MSYNPSNPESEKFMRMAVRPGVIVEGVQRTVPIDRIPALNALRTGNRSNGSSDTESSLDTFCPPQRLFVELTRNGTYCILGQLMVFPNDLKDLDASHVEVFVVQNLDADTRRALLDVILDNATRPLYSPTQFAKLAITGKLDSILSLGRADGDGLRSYANTARLLAPGQLSRRTFEVTERLVDVVKAIGGRYDP